MDVAALGAGSASSASLTGNTNQASAAINQADNGLSVAAVRAGGVHDDTSPAQASASAVYAIGDHVLLNWQVATGNAVATASMQLRAAGTGNMDGSAVSIGGNSTSADASANRALNAVSATALSGATPNAGLANNQRNSAAVSASAVTDIAVAINATPGTDNVPGSFITLNGNTTTSLARGNAADNQLALSGSGPLSAMPAMAIMGPEATVHADAALLNVQVNAGAVTASAADTGYSIPLNSVGTPIANSSLGVAGNSVSAAAYGNVASNAITIAPSGSLPVAALVNSQSNSGPVTALVTGASFRIVSGPMGSGTLSATGNQITAAATGNLANSAIAGTR